MNKKTIEIHNKKYQVKIAESELDKIKGLLGVKELPKNEGMLFTYDEPLTVGFWMKDTEIPLDIVFINDDCEVLSIYKGQPFNENIAEEDDVKYVLELNLNSGVKVGDELDIDSEEELPTMKVIGPNGEVQMELEGGERIFSRKNTRTLINMAKRADKSKSDTDYKRLGNKMFSYIKLLDNREPDYVELKDKK